MNLDVADVNTGDVSVVDLRRLDRIGMHHTDVDIHAVHCECGVSGYFARLQVVRSVWKVADCELQVFACEWKVVGGEW